MNIMKPKRKNILMHKLYCICQLQLEVLDELHATTDKMIKYKSDIIGLCEELNNNVANTYTIQKSTYFHELTNKIDTLLRKEFNENM